MNTKKRKILSFVLACTFLLSGCGVTEALDKFNDGKKFGTAWVNSEIEGAINESTAVNLKDDYFTAVNKDWILDQQVGDSGAVIELMNAQKTVDKQKIEILKGTAPECEDPESLGMRCDELEHTKEILEIFADAAGDTDGRNLKGAEPLRPYIDAINEISSLSEMDAYILDEGGMNLVGQPFISFSLGATWDMPEIKRLQAAPILQSDLSLQSTKSYRKMDDTGVKNKEINSEIVHLVLSNLGWDEKDIKKVLKGGYDFEYKLAKNYTGGETYYTVENYNKDHTVMTGDELQSLAGLYPVKRILEHLNCEGADIVVELSGYMEDLANIYTQENLSGIKAYYIMHTVYKCADLLDIPTKEKVYEIVARSSKVKSEDEDNPTGDTIAPDNDTLTPEEKELKTVIDDYISVYLPYPLEMVYIASYCSSECKEKILSMVDTIKDEFHSVIESADWLSEESRANMSEKLDSMEVLALYPYEFISYKGLQLSKDQSLVDMVHDIFAYETLLSFEGVNEYNDRSRWDLRTIPTTTVNAYNIIDRNAIAVLAGIVSNNFVFDEDFPDEVNLGRLGVIIGHEITHGFDSMGYDYDRYGFKQLSGTQNVMMAYDDKSEFSKKVFSLTIWYASLTPLPDGSPYTASVSGEAIADMGGMKTVLSSAEKIQGFDYDLFFRSFAEMWRKVNTLEIEQSYAKQDTHPLAFLRTNITLQQFDKFFETYGIEEGDGMYIAPEDRILLW